MIKLGVTSLLLLFFVWPATATITASSHDALDHATIVNIYWDSNWDADNPTMQRSRIDALTAAMINSSYFKNLSEYGVVSVTFGGSFLPASQCSSKPAATISLVNATAPSIDDFIGCEHDNGDIILQQNNVIYNIIFPQSSLETDITQTVCNGPGSATAWHFHGTFSLLGPFTGQPFWTIIQTNPACVSNPDPQFVLQSLLHEDVETLTNPEPVNVLPPRVDVESEIADICQDRGNQTTAIFVDQSGNSVLDHPVVVPDFWSNSRQACVSFTDSTQPQISSISFTDWGAQSSFTVSGSGFGTLPTSSGSPYIKVRKTVGNEWEVGNTINGDTVSVHISSSNWTNTRLSNAGFNGTGFNNTPATPVAVTVCNPESLKCTALGSTTPPGPYNPRLTINDKVVGAFTLTGSLRVDEGSTQVLSLMLQHQCNPCSASTVVSLTPGVAHSFTQILSPLTLAIKSTTNGCHSVTMALGQERSCLIDNQGPPIIPRPPICGVHCPQGQP